MESEENFDLDRIRLPNAKLSRRGGSPEEGRQRVPHLGPRPEEIGRTTQLGFGEEKGTLVLAATVGRRQG
jgi:hypothetical protein